jgi:hypothetical protein
MQNNSELEYYQRIIDGCADCVDSETYGDFLCAYERLTSLINSPKEEENCIRCEPKMVVSFQEQDIEDPNCIQMNLLELLNAFNNMGFDAEIEVRPTQNPDGKGTISVIYTK